MRVTDTGARGSPATAIIHRLLAGGHEVVGLTRAPERASDLAARGATVVQGSIADPNAVAAAARGSEVLIHAAASSDHRADPEVLAWINVAGTENVVNAARHAGCERLVVISCADVTLSTRDRIHLKEDQPMMAPPFGAHAQSKALAEEIALSASDDDLEVCALRPAWLWGPGDSSLLPRLCAEALERGGLQLVGAGQSLIATTHIDNLASAAMQAVTLPAAAHQAYYIADNEFCEVGEFFTKLSEALGLPPPRRGLPFPFAYALARWTKGPLSRVDVVKRGRASHFDIGQACQDLEWEPTVSMTDGMEALAAWAKAEGGAQAIARRARPPANAESIAEQKQAAHAHDAA